MLSLLPLVVALASVPSPDATDAPRPTPLTEIGRTRTAPICTAIVVHANGAITTALDNDRALAILTTNLRNIDFDRLSEIQRRNAIDELMKEAGAVRINGKLADAEIKQLRAYAAASNDPQRKAELKAFADALGGAIYRQTKVANTFMKDVTVIQGRQDASEVREIRRQDDAVIDPVTTQRMTSQRAAAPLLPDGPQSFNTVMRSIAGDLTDLNTGIAYDEGVAADHSVAATSGC